MKIIAPAIDIETEIRAKMILASNERGQIG